MFRKNRRIEPGPGQESVWDYPRPPRIDEDSRLVEVFFNGKRIISTSNALRVLETSHPPTFYLPMADVDQAVLHRSERGSFCEWKGQAAYFHIVVDDVRAQNAAWYYPTPTQSMAQLKDHISLYPAMMERCVVGGEVVRSQEGDFYGGWITSEIVGPFKGGPGTFGW